MAFASLGDSVFYASLNRPKYDLTDDSGKNTYCPTFLHRALSLVDIRQGGTGCIYNNFSRP